MAFIKSFLNDNFELIYVYFNESDKIHKCYSSLKLMIQIDLDVGFFTIFFVKLLIHETVVIKLNSRSKPVQHFIQHFFCMFDEMLDEKLRVSYDEFSGLHTFMQHSIQHSNVHSFINSNSK